ncbi:hypothetical protein ANOM_002999 [Aspergillus nomiae NRRL 13137]|uniref:DUF7587 domain-containing protein n=1 Tax=Aspergillus nomiae NRRL (strain ATCC 15546 / NRRL 13137 / CBS 260.88 / M93) TaxID=1509407 RepID=A0A0L1JBP5_ASPN3|nr:uncharacterized protein ANOM_002999 [Aspergillus nomiae NRRL 13137]KNG89135.1 hypothetical protein ANOM_002999 [Aspergillus nomiae NRRL 13137]
MSQLPYQFFRCQHDGPFTWFSPWEGFESRGHYHLPLSHWLNREKIEEHLDWRRRPLQPSPFISVFNNEYDANRRAQYHVGHGCSGVFVAEIDTTTLEPVLLPITFAHETVQLPVWTNSDNTTFISTRAVRWHLGVSHSVSQLSEWFALNYIPASMIRHTVAF